MDLEGRGVGCAEMHEFASTDRVIWNVRESFADLKRKFCARTQLATTSGSLADPRRNGTGRPAERPLRRHLPCKSGRGSRRLFVRKRRERGRLGRRSSGTRPGPEIGRSGQHPWTPFRPVGVSSLADGLRFLSTAWPDGDEDAAWHPSCRRAGRQGFECKESFNVACRMS